MANKFVTAIFGDYSKKEVKKLQKTVDKILELEEKYQAMDDKDYNLAMSAPGAYKVLSAATYKEMIEIVKILNKRITQAKKLEKKLEKVKAQYEKLATDFELSLKYWFKP